MSTARPKSTTPLLLIHAFPVNKAVWEPVRAQLAADEISVASIDLFGFGDRSCERPAADDGLDALGDQVAEWIKKSGATSAVLAGLSLGGYVAMNVVRRYPELVAGLVLADTKSSADNGDGAAGRRAFADRAEERGNAWVAEAMMPKLLGETSRASRPEVVAAVTKMVAETPAETIAWVQRAMADRPDSSVELAAFAGPVLVVVGSEDAISTADECRELADSIPTASLVVIEGAGHLSPLEDPTAVAGAISEWWQTTSHD